MSDDYLGYLCWYTVTTRDKAPSLDVTPEDLEAWFGELDLDKGFLPKQTRSVDAFRVTTSNQTADYVGDHSLRYRLRVVEGKQRSDTDLIKRYVLRETLADGSTTRVANITYYRPRRRTPGRVHGSEDVKYQLHKGLGGIDKAEVEAFIERCLEQYEAIRRSLTPNRMRRLLLDYLTFKNAVPIQDGLYFIPLDAVEEIQALRVLTGRLGERCRMLLVPLVDEQEQRDMLREAIDSEVEDRARGTLERISAWLDRNPSKAPTPGVMSAWRDEMRGLQRLLVRYGDALEAGFPAAADALEELQAAVARLG